MRTRHMHDDFDRFSEEPRLDRQLAHDSATGLVLLVIVVALFTAYMWYTAAHYSDFYNPYDSIGGNAADNLPTPNPAAGMQNTNTVTQSPGD